MVGFKHTGLFGDHVPPADGIPVPGLRLKPGDLGLRGLEFREDCVLLTMCRCPQRLLLKLERLTDGLL